MSGEKISEKIGENRTIRKFSLLLIALEVINE